MVRAKPMYYVLHAWPGKIQNRSFPDYNRDDLVNILGSDTLLTEEYNAGRLNVALQVGFPDFPYEKYLGHRYSVPAPFKELFAYVSSLFSEKVCCIEISESGSSVELYAYGEEWVKSFFFLKDSVGLSSVGSDNMEGKYNKELLSLKTAVAMKYVESSSPVKVHSVKYWHVPCSYLHNGESVCIRGFSEASEKTGFNTKLVPGRYAVIYYAKVSDKE